MSKLTAVIHNHYAFNHRHSRRYSGVNLIAVMGGVEVLDLEAVCSRLPGLSTDIPAPIIL